MLKEELINYINQFNEAEGGLTISLDPQDGSIQKLFADDTQIVIFQEDKISRSPVNKDFISKVKNFWNTN